MISNIPNYVLSTLEQCVDQVKSNLRPYVNDPISDFTRNRKLNFEQLVRFYLQLQAKSNNSELNDYFTDVESMPSSSALCQAKGKVSYKAFERIFQKFSHSFKLKKTWKGYHILACDGSDVNIPSNKNDIETLCQSGIYKSYNQFHLNALYDCKNEIYWDVSIDSATKTRECDAMKEMIFRRLYPENSIILADRGYEKYELIACCIEEKQKFVIRVKEKDSNGILSTVDLPDGEFDTVVTRKLTRRQTKETKENKEYVLLMNQTEFSYLGINDEYYELSFRVVCFKITDGTYEYLVTNLDASEFSIQELKELYHMRWSEETGFRKLKYTIGLVNFHSKKSEYIKQEIYSRLIFFNLSNIIIQLADIHHKTEKYEWKVSFTAAVTNIRNFLNGKIDGIELMERIKKVLAPLRPERSYPRKVLPQSAKSLNNRIA